MRMCTCTCKYWMGWWRRGGRGWSSAGRRWMKLVGSGFWGCFSGARYLAARRLWKCRGGGKGVVFHFMRACSLQRRIELGGAAIALLAASDVFAGERLVWAGGAAQVHYRLPWAALQGHRLGRQRCIELRLSPSDFLDRIAALIPRRARIGTATLRY